MSNRNRIFAFVVIVACAISCGFSVPAANEEPVAGETASGKSSPAPDEKSEETVPREFLGFADVSEFRGVIDDPDGYVNLRKEKRADAPVITKVKAGEPFQFKKKERDDWCEVKLKSGATGWMDCSRIKLFFTKDDLPPKSEKGDEIDEQAREQGINYHDVTQAAARGDKKALKTFFSLGADGAGAEEHEGVTSVVIHLIGDDTFANFLREQTRGFRDQMGFVSDVAYPFDTKEYFHQHFPKSAKILFPDYEKAIGDYTRAIRRNPKDSRAYRERGAAEFEKEHWDRAIADLDRAIELDPKDDVAYDDRGRAYAEKSEYDAAIKDIQKAIQLNPKAVAYYLNLGSCQLFNRNPHEAIATSLKALELSPENAVLIKTNLAHGYLFDNQFEKAKAIYLENKDKNLPDGSGTFTAEVLDDFRQFEQEGISHPDMEKIKALLTSNTPDKNATNPH
ncbi:MAG: tetratricopeptide repeat protein [Verrucomicrobia bacterium]|nr:tetratricopeptide repeat protein [Verrucomicrobiota bacterium]